MILPFMSHGLLHPRDPSSGSFSQPGGTRSLPTDLVGESMAGGTPTYMSPEQALGEPDVDGRSDLYAVGCLGYWLLTGAVVFQGRTPMETVVMHVQREPEPPSRRTEIDIPTELESVIMDCLAKDRSDRPQTADTLRDRLGAVPLASVWSPDRARQWWDTHRPPSPARVLEVTSGARSGET